MSAALAVEGLAKRFGDVQALDDVHFTVRPGELFGFVGANGAGKSTTMRIALGLLSADAGQVRYDGRPIDLSIRRRFGYMPEERGLYAKMRVGEQLSYFARLHGATASDARAAAKRWADRLGLGSRVDDPVEALSLGNQQRAQLGVALVHDPQVLILDEPFSGLDPVAVDVMAEVLTEKASEGVPVLFSSHQLELVERLCHRVGIIAAGRMQAVGTVDELRDDGTVRYRLVVDGAPPGWVDRVPGVLAASALDERTVVVTLADQAGEQALLDAARAEGTVRAFTPDRPSLAERFRAEVTR